MMNLTKDFVSEKRAQLNAKLVEILGSGNVYFEPPESVKLQFPCIVYERSAGDTDFANNMPYRFQVRYEITAISRQADNPVIGKLAMSLPSILYNRHFVTDGLHHDVFSVYY